MANYKVKLCLLAIIFVFVFIFIPILASYSNSNSNSGLSLSAVWFRFMQIVSIVKSIPNIGKQNTVSQDNSLLNYSNKPILKVHKHRIERKRTMLIDRLKLFLNSWSQLGKSCLFDWWCCYYYYYYYGCKTSQKFCCFCSYFCCCRCRC